MIMQDTTQVVNAGAFDRLWVRHVMIHDFDVRQGSSLNLASDLGKVLQNDATPRTWEGAADAQGLVAQTAAAE
jgi:hypothetical protein